jgi:NADH-quinone oxidoreductase subunit L
MGGLRKRMPVTFWTFLAGTLAIAGVPPFSGFYSKDAILAIAGERHAYGQFALGTVVAVLTAFYMFRLLYVVFLGPERSPATQHAQESPPVILWPLRILAVFSLIGGFIGVENVYRLQFSPAGAQQALSTAAQLVAPFTQAPLAASFGLLAMAVGFLGARALYANAKLDPLPERLGALSNAMRNRFYFDELYQATVIRLNDLLSAFAAWCDQWIIQGFCIGLVRGGTDLAGRALRLLQTGSLQTYAFLFALGVALVLYLALK